MTRTISLAALTVLERRRPNGGLRRRAGFSHIAFRLLPLRLPSANTTRCDTPLLREVERRLADTGVRVLDVEIFRLKPATPRRRLRSCDCQLRTPGASELLVAETTPTKPA